MKLYRFSPIKTVDELRAAIPALIIGAICTLASLSFQITMAAPHIDCSRFSDGADIPGNLLVDRSALYPYYQEEGLPFVIRQVPTDTVCDTVHYQWWGVVGDLAAWSLFGYLIVLAVRLLSMQRGVSKTR